LRVALSFSVFLPIRASGVAGEEGERTDPPSSLLVAPSRSVVLLGEAAPRGAEREKRRGGG